ncbi:alpha/beta hydrolase [Pseudonocardia acaciae]|uniref:alpha/beta hydrolase n=1 Tax=Pseudonocardia acaciae TaxID=551276 RepID=UPI00048CF240|nr:alpha/beta hydrolase [Pseudonocardia acaciae]
MPVKPVPFDPDLMPAYTRLVPGGGTPLGPDSLPAARAGNTAPVSMDEVIGNRPVAFEDRVVPGPAGAPDLTLAILRPKGGVTTPAAVYNIHGGGMCMGNRFWSIDSFVDLVARYGIVAAAVEYRLAPEHPHPAPLEDCYAGLSWVAAHAGELGVEPGRIVVMGRSAGGGLAAGVSLLARDRGGPAIAGQGLYCPMIDDRNESVSSHQYDTVGWWNRNSNHWGWRFLLGEEAGGPHVSPYAAPARATDLSGLPPAYIDAGACEVFRDEAVDYATRIWATGGQAELHIWGGAFHGFTEQAPDVTVSRASKAARDSWLERILALTPVPA